MIVISNNIEKIKDIEKGIFEKEGFPVIFKHNGRDVRDDKLMLNLYEYKNKTKGTQTVAKYLKKLKKHFPDLDVEIPLPNKKIAKGQMKISTVRDTYLI